MIKEAIRASEKILNGSKDLPNLKGEGEDAVTVNKLIDQHNFVTKNLSLKGNFNGQIIDNVKFASGEEKIISHSLGIVPRYRIILRQEGNGVISDIPSGWTKNSIKLKNNGTVQVTVSIMLVRE